MLIRAPRLVDLERAPWQDNDSALTPGLMLQKIPGVFLAGEMIDWEAPTGGYLMQGCFATGTLAGESALEWLTQQ